MEIVVRKITLEDAEEITGLTSQLGYSIPWEQMLQHIRSVTAHDDCDAFVAEHKKQIIGWIGLAYRIQLESIPFCEINGLVVHTDYRGKGVGKMLIEKAKSWTAKKGCHLLRLRTNVKRNDAHKFYTALGFEEIKQQKVFEIKL